MKSFKRKCSRIVPLCRYGGINKMIKQKGNYDPKTEYESKHRAPERKGFYAFIFPFIDTSLLAGQANGGKTRLKDFNNSRNMYKKFEAIGGEIWTHLKPLSDDKIIKRCGFYWYKMKVSDLNDAIAQELEDDIHYMNLDMRDNAKEGDKLCTIKNPSQEICRSDYEVFICRDTIIS